MSERSGHSIERALDRREFIQMNETHRPDYWIRDGWENYIRQLNTQFDVAFLGNSLTRGGSFQQYFKDIKVCNLSVSGSTLNDMRKRVALLKATNPRKVFIMTGANDLLVSSIDKYIDEYRELITEIRQTLPTTETYVQSLLPMNSNAGYKQIAPANIIEANTRVRLMSAELHVTYVDLYNLYAQHDSFPDEYSTDGLHLKTEAYTFWVEAISEFVQN